MSHSLGAPRDIIRYRRGNLAYYDFGAYFSSSFETLHVHIEACRNKTFAREVRISRVCQNLG